MTIANGSYGDIERNVIRNWDMYVICADERKGMWRRIKLSEIVALRINRNLSLSTYTASDMLDMM